MIVSLDNSSVNLFNDDDHTQSTLYTLLSNYIESASIKLIIGEVNINELGLFSPDQRTKRCMLAKRLLQLHKMCLNATKEESKNNLFIYWRYHFIEELINLINNWCPGFIKDTSVLHKINEHEINFNLNQLELLANDDYCDQTWLEDVNNAKEDARIYQFMYLINPNMVDALIKQIKNNYHLHDKDIKFEKQHKELLDFQIELLSLDTNGKDNFINDYNDKIFKTYKKILDRHRNDIILFQSRNLSKESLSQFFNDIPMSEVDKAFNSEEVKENWNTPFFSGESITKLSENTSIDILFFLILDRINGDIFPIKEMMAVYIDQFYDILNHTTLKRTKNKRNRKSSSTNIENRDYIKKGAGIDMEYTCMALKSDIFLTGDVLLAKSLNRIIKNGQYRLKKAILTKGSYKEEFERYFIR